MAGKGLTSKQEAYVQALLRPGATQRVAYREAYPAARNWKDAAVDVAACRCLDNAKVRQRYDELIALAASKVLWSLERAARETIELRDIAFEHVRKTKGIEANIDDNGKRELADLPKAAATVITQTTAELNKMFGIYDSAGGDDGKVSVIDDV